VLAPGLHTLRIEYGAPESSERIETDFPAVAFSWDELGLRGVVSGDAGGLRRVILHIPSLSGKDAVWTDVSSGVPQQVSFDGNGTAVVNADFGVFRSCREFSLVALPIVDVPQVEIVEPHEGAVLKSGVAVRAAVSGGVADYVELLVDGVSVGQVSASPYEWGWNTAEVSVVEGPHVLTAAAHGAYGTSQASISVSVDNATFDDVPKFAATWQHVEALAGAGITTGCSRTPPLYCPYGGATRAQMAVFLCRAAGKGPLYAETPTFSDVPKANAYYGWIERLADAESWGGLSPTDGCGRQGTQRYFCPDSPVTRGQVAKFLCRATGTSEMPSCSGMFVDVPAGSESCAYVERLAVGGSWPGGVPVTCGCGGSGATRWYCPSSPLTREQLAVFICRAFGISM
jgi:hypothetical protein